MPDEQQPSETLIVSGGEVEKNRFTENSGSIFKDNSGSITINHHYSADLGRISPCYEDAVRNESARAFPVQESELGSSETILIEDRLNNLFIQKKELEIRLECIESEISRFKSMLKSETDPNLAVLLHWLSGKRDLAEKYGKIALRGFQRLRQEAEARGDLDDFYFEVESYLELIDLSLEKNDKIFLQESIIPPTFADSSIYENASSDAYRAVFRILKEYIPRDDVEASLRSKLENHFDALLERLQVYF